MIMSYLSMYLSEQLIVSYNLFSFYKIVYTYKFFMLMLNFYIYKLLYV